MALTPERLAELHRFAEVALGTPVSVPEPASADASFRSYWRVAANGASHIVMNAPPGKEDVGPWLDIAQRLRAAGLNAPQVLAHDAASGFILMSDLGSRLYLAELDEARVDALYSDALAALLALQTRGDANGLPRYDEPRLVAELELFPEWFLKRHLGVVPECEEWDIVESAFRVLVNNAHEQPPVFVHRDYHSRNLLVVDAHSPGVVDFQDAVLGPVTYDLVSLLRDCYVEWPQARVAAWAEDYRRDWCHASGITVDAARWQRWFDLMGLQRHLKVLGIFCRLWYRDGKRGYLNDLPLVLRYTLHVAERYPELEEFAHWLRARVGERNITQSIGESA